MKHTFFKILCFAISAISSTFSLATDYSTMNYAQFFGLATPFTKDSLKKSHTRLSLQYSSDKAENFITRQRYDNYSKQINTEYQRFINYIDYPTNFAHYTKEKFNYDQTYAPLFKQYEKEKDDYNKGFRTTKPEKPSRVPPAPIEPIKEEEPTKPLTDTIEQIIINDIFNEIQTYAKNPIASYTGFSTIATDISGFLGIPANEKIEKLLFICYGLSHKLYQKNVQDLITTEKKTLNEALANAKKTYRTIEDLKTNIEKTTFNAFLVSYLDQEMRNTIVNAIIDLANEYIKNKLENKALEIVREMSKIIDLYWNKGFPIGQTQADALYALKTQLEAKPVGIPASVLNDIDKQLKNAQNEPNPLKFFEKYNPIIVTLNAYLPDSNTKILDVYATWTGRYITYKMWPDAKRAIDFVLNTEMPRLKPSVTTPEFTAVEKKLHDQLREINENTPAPTPAPVPDVTALSKELQQLKTQLEQLSRNLTARI